jgi:uncharacterized membrane protein YukC
MFYLSQGVETGLFYNLLLLVLGILFDLFTIYQLTKKRLKSMQFPDSIRKEINRTVRWIGIGIIISSVLLVFAFVSILTPLFYFPLLLSILASTNVLKMIYSELDEL